MPRYEVLDNVSRDKRLYQPGEPIELDEAEAAPLLALRVIGKALQTDASEQGRIESEGNSGGGEGADPVGAPYGRDESRARPAPAATAASDKAKKAKP